MGSSLAFAIWIDGLKREKIIILNFAPLMSVGKQRSRWDCQSRRTPRAMTYLGNSHGFLHLKFISGHQRQRLAITDTYHLGSLDLFIRCHIEPTYIYGPWRKRNTAAYSSAHFVSSALDVGKATQKWPCVLREVGEDINSGPFLLSSVIRLDWVLR